MRIESENQPLTTNTQQPTPAADTTETSSNTQRATLKDDVVTLGSNNNDSVTYEVPRVTPPDTVELHTGGGAGTVDPN